MVLDKNDVWTLNLTSYDWTEVTTSATKPSARRYPSSIFYNGQMVMFGGKDGSNKNDVWTLKFDLLRLDRIDNKCDKTQCASVLTRPFFTTGQMVMFGGYDGSSKNDVWTLNLTSYNWTELTTSTTNPVRDISHSSVLYDGQMVMFGGNDGSPG